MSPGTCPWRIQHSPHRCVASETHQMLSEPDPYPATPDRALQRPHSLSRPCWGSWSPIIAQHGHLEVPSLQLPVALLARLRHPSESRLSSAKGQQRKQQSETGDHGIAHAGDTQHRAASHSSHPKTRTVAPQIFRPQRGLRAWTTVWVLGQSRGRDALSSIDEGSGQVEQLSEPEPQDRRGRGPIWTSHAAGHGGPK